MKFFCPLVQALAAPKVTIAVCTGADCRVDGCTQALRELQKQNANEKDKTLIRVTGRPCLGPCGDGPCVLVLDQQGKRVVEDQDDKVSGSLISPDLFGTNPRGIYQVRTTGQVHQVSRIAKQAAGKSLDELTPPPENANEIIVQGTRPFWDRPRNERKVLQRIVQVLILGGLHQYDVDHSRIDSLQFAIAAVLFLSSDLILKEGLFYELKKRFS